jgi:hypothetical protein
VDVRGSFRNAYNATYNLYRRLFGRWDLDDPRPAAQASPYTFFLPSQKELESLQPGDLVKLTFRSHPPGIEFDAERMWVELTAVNLETQEGKLANDPSDMPQLKFGDMIQFQRSHIIATNVEVSDNDSHREYWERCRVDKCVTYDGVPVHFLYRDVPDTAKDGDKYSDSGWRIRGDYRGLTDEQIEARESEYVALGRVLNADDTWLHLIDEPIGSRFIRDWATGKFVPLTQ